MSRGLSRRTFIAGASTAAGLLLSGCTQSVLPPTYGSLLGLGEALTFASHRLLLGRQSLVREFDRAAISKNFPAINTTLPQSEMYRRLLHGQFLEWRLPIGGKVARPTSLSLHELKHFPARSQITQHNCEQGWSAIAQWTGVQLSRVLRHVGVHADARYVVFRCADGWWDSIDMLDALHPQTLLTYGMNGRDLPVPHGAPVRLRVEHQLGYKSLKYVSSIDVVDRLDGIEDGSGAGVVAYGYSWYAGI